MHAAGEVLRGRVEERPVVGERDVVEEEPLLVGVERRPAAVLALHAEEPAEPALDRPGAAGRRPGARSGASAISDHRGVVEVRVEGVVVLERPAAGLRACGRLTCQSPGSSDLAVQQPVRGADAAPGGRRGRPTLEQRVDRERGVPHGRHARLARGSASRLLDAERLDLLELPGDQRVVVGVAEEPHRQDPRSPWRGRCRRGRPGTAIRASSQSCAASMARPAPGAGAEALPHLEEAVDADEEVLPRQRAPRRAYAGSSRWR